jgi:hypothetical protein
MRKNVVVSRGILLSFIVLLLAIGALFYVLSIRKQQNGINTGRSLLDTLKWQSELSSGEKLYFFSSVDGLSLRKGGDSQELRDQLLASAIWGKDINLLDTEQSTGTFKAERVIFELVDTPQPYYEQQFATESAPHNGFGITKYDKNTLLIKIYFSERIFNEMSSDELSWMFYTRAQEILKVWEYRERYGSITDFITQRQEDAAQIQAKASQVYNSRGVEVFPVVVLKGNK